MTSPRTPSSPPPEPRSPASDRGPEARAGPADPGAGRRPWEHCVTCSDEGVPMRVESVDEGTALAICVGEDGARVEVQTALVEGVRPGDLLLVHAGTALLRLDGGAT